MKGKIAVVTGSSRGIGREIALAFGREGVNVAVHYNKSKDNAENVVNSILDMGVDSAAFKADISKSDDVIHLFSKIIEHFGTIDILVNNAATVINGSIVTCTDNKYLAIMGSGMDGAFFCTREVLKIMLEKNLGKIINISSVAGTGAFPETSAYSAAKAGVIGLTRAVAREVARYGIQVNCIAPGYIETPLVAKLTQTESGKKMVNAQNIPLGRLGQMSEVAASVLFFASCHADYITGEVLKVAGGLTTDLSKL